MDSRQFDTDNPEFQNVMRLIDTTSRSVFMTGKAGTGKSTFLKHITANTTKKHIVLAPTGIAAVNVGGQTLHSFFRIPFKPLMPDDPDLSEKVLKKRLKYSSEKVRLIKDLELIVIDEISMVRADIIDFIDKILRLYSGNRREPFGGKQLLLVGDIFQLEPVVTGDMRDILRRVYPACYFFNARVFNDFSPISIELKKVYRQNDADFVALLDRVRSGEATPADKAQINSRVSIGADKTGDDGRMKMTIATRREMVDHINESRLAALKTPERVYHGIIKGDFPMNAVPTDIELTLKEGAQVVFVKNDPDKRWVNGSIGIIEEATDDDIAVRLENGERHSIEPEKWGNIIYRYDEESGKVSEEEIGSFTQYPVKLAWALTIHKSQGLTFDNVVIDVGRGAFSGGQSYVALSRCTSLEGIKLLSTINERDIFVNPAIERFSRSFNDVNRIDAAISASLAKAAYRDAAAAFDRHDWRAAASCLCDAVGLRNDLSSPAAPRLIARKLTLVDRLQAEIDRLNGLLDEDRRRFAALAAEYVTLGDDCSREGWDISAAIANYDKAISLDPGCTAAYIGKARALFADGDSDTAVDCLNRAADIDTADWRALYELGVYYLGAGRLPEALERLLTAADRCDDVAEIHLAIAEVYDTVGDAKMGRRHRTRARNLRKGK